MYRKHITYLKKLFRIANIPLEHNLKSPRYVGVDMTAITVQDVQTLLKIIHRVQFAKREEVSRRIANKLALGLLIMATSGLRVYELTKLPLSYIDLDKRLIRVPPSVAKTGQPRVTFITKEVRSLLKQHHKPPAP